MPWIEKEQLEQAKSVDLLSYLQVNEPHELRKSKYGDGEFRTATHSSLVISNGRWHWNKGGFGGRSAIDFLIKVRGMEFMDAVGVILDSRGMSFSCGASAVGSAASYADSSSYSVCPSALPVENNKQAQSKAGLKLPATALLPANAVAYLQKRGISPEIINRCLELGILCENRKNQNAIFIGLDENGKPRFACQRGMRDDFKADVSGSDKRYSFSMPADDLLCPRLIVFESPIDLLSHMTMQQRGDSACGLSFEADAHRLSLGGTSDVALIAYLEREPLIAEVHLCLDADEAGQKAAGKITEKLAENSRYKHIKIYNHPPQGAKDYNEVLLRSIAAEREQKQQTQPPGRREAAL